MITYSCDACGKSEEAPTMGDGLDRMRPLGWLFRAGRVPRGKNVHEVQVLVCSEKCAKAYDRVECEEVGFAWRIAATGENEKIVRILPLRVPKG